MILEQFETKSVSVSHIINRCSLSDLEDLLDSLHNKSSNLLNNENIKDVVKKFRTQSSYKIPHTYTINNTTYFLRKVDIKEVNEFYLATPASFDMEYVEKRITTSTFHLTTRYNRFLFSPISYFCHLINGRDYKADWETWDMQCKLYMGLFRNLALYCVYPNDIKKSIEKINESNGTLGELEYFKSTQTDNNLIYLLDVSDDGDKTNIYELVEVA